MVRKQTGVIGTHRKVGSDFWIRSWSHWAEWRGADNSGYNGQVVVFW